HDRGVPRRLRGAWMGFRPLLYLLGGVNRPAEALHWSRIGPRIALIAALCSCAGTTAGAATQTRTLTALPVAGAQFHCTWSQSEARRAEIAGKLGAAGLRTVRIDPGWGAPPPRRRGLSR